MADGAWSRPVRCAPSRFAELLATSHAGALTAVGAPVGTGVAVTAGDPWLVPEISGPPWTFCQAGPLCPWVRREWRARRSGAEAVPRVSAAELRSAVRCAGSRRVPADTGTAGRPATGCCRPRRSGDYAGILRLPRPDRRLGSRSRHVRPRAVVWTAAAALALGRVVDGVGEPWVPALGIVGGLLVPCRCPVTPSYGFTVVGPPSCGSSGLVSRATGPRRSGGTRPRVDAQGGRTERVVQLADT